MDKVNEIIDMVIKYMKKVLNMLMFWRSGGTEEQNEESSMFKWLRNWGPTKEKSTWPPSGGAPLGRSKTPMSREEGVTAYLHFLDAERVRLHKRIAKLERERFTNVPI